MKGLIGADPSRKVIRSRSGIGNINNIMANQILIIFSTVGSAHLNILSISVAHLPGSLTYRVENGVEYAMFPPVFGTWSGYIRINENGVKKCKRAATMMVRSVADFKRLKAPSSELIAYKSPIHPLLCF